MCTPLFVLLNKFHPEGMSDFLENLKANRAHWADEPDVTKVPKADLSPASSNKKVRPAFTQPLAAFPLAPVKSKSSKTGLASSSTGRLPTVTNIYNLDITLAKGTQKSKKSHVDM
jgi:hypothetical protein